MQNMECPKNSMIIARQWTLCKMRKGKGFKSMLEVFFFFKTLTRIAETNGSTRIGRQVLHGHQKRTHKIREQLEVVRQRRLDKGRSKNVLQKSGNNGIGKLCQVLHLLLHRQLGALPLLTHHLGGPHQSGRNASSFFAFRKWRFPCERREVQAVPHTSHACTRAIFSSCVWLKVFQVFLQCTLQ